MEQHGQVLADLPNLMKQIKAKTAETGNSVKRKVPNFKGNDT